MNKDASDFEKMEREDGIDYAKSNAAGQAFGFALAYALQNQHLFTQEDGVSKFIDALYEQFTDNRPESLSHESVTVLHGIVEGMLKLRKFGPDRIREF